MSQIFHYIAIGKNGTIKSFSPAENAERAPELRIRIAQRPPLLEPFVELEELTTNHIAVWYGALGASNSPTSTSRKILCCNFSDSLK